MSLESMATRSFECIPEFDVGSSKGISHGNWFEIPCKNIRCCLFFSFAFHGSFLSRRRQKEDKEIVAYSKLTNWVVNKILFLICALNSIISTATVEKPWSIHGTKACFYFSVRDFTMVNPGSSVNGVSQCPLGVVLDEAHPRVFQILDNLKIWRIEYTELPLLIGGARDVTKEETRWISMGNIAGHGREMRNTVLDCGDGVGGGGVYDEATKFYGSVEGMGVLLRASRE